MNGVPPPAHAAVAPSAAGFRWPEGVRAAACFTFDLDAESPVLFEHPEAATWLDVLTSVTGTLIPAADACACASA